MREKRWAASAVQSERRSTKQRKKFTSNPDQQGTNYVTMQENIRPREHWSRVPLLGAATKQKQQRQER